MAGSKEMREKSGDLLAAMQARTASGSAAKKLPAKPEDAKTGPGQLAIFSGQLADAIARAEAAEAEVESLRSGGPSEELADARRRLAEAETALEEARSRVPRRTARLDELHEVPGRRRMLSAEQYGELKANLANNPLAHPVSVRERPEGGFEIVSGNNRVSIYRELGRDEIDITILELDDDETERTAFYSNLLAPTLTDWEKFAGFRSRMSRKGLTQAQAAEEAGVSQSYVSMLMSFGDLPDEAREILSGRPGLLGCTAAAKLAALASSRPDRVAEAVGKLLSGELRSQEAAVQYAEAQPAAAKPSRPRPLVVRRGKSKFCELTRSDRTLRISFADPAEAEAALSAVRELLEARAKAKAND